MLFVVSLIFQVNILKPSGFEKSIADDCQRCIVFVYQNIFVLITVILVKGWAEPGHQEECGE